MVSYQNQSCGAGKLVHLVQQVRLYQTVYLPILVLSSFLIEFFKQLPCLVHYKVTEKFEDLFSIPMDSGAVTHEESEYVIGFIIRVDKKELPWIFR